jgi:hypothetical protein
MDFIAVREVMRKHDVFAMCDSEIIKTGSITDK